MFIKQITTTEAADLYLGISSPAQRPRRWLSVRKKIERACRSFIQQRTGWEREGLVCEQLLGGQYEIQPNELARWKQRIMRGAGEVCDARR